MTDHYIQRRKPDRDLLAPLAEASDTEQTAYRGEVALFYPPHLPATPETELYLAVAQVADGSNLTSGISRLQQAIESYRPKQADFYFALADAYRKARQYEKAVPYYQETLRRKPDYLAARLDCAAALGSLGRLPAAVEMLEAAVAAAPRDAASLNALGESYLRVARVDEAIAILRRALSIESGLPEIYVNLGMALSRKDNASDVVDALRGALRISPNLGAAHNDLAGILAA
jgi:tetratricopeptide (TPR) repeat protein